MSLSLHNFLFGAFDPSARLAVDKPPLDLWLQVASREAVRLHAVRAEAARGAGRHRRRGAPLRAGHARVRTPRRARGSGGACGAAGRRPDLAQRHDGLGHERAHGRGALARAGGRAEAAREPALPRRGRGRPRVQRQAVRGAAGGAAGRPPVRARGATRRCAPARAPCRRRRAHGRRVGVVGRRGLAGARARPAVPDRLDRRDGVERHVRVGRAGPDQRQGGRERGAGPAPPTQPPPARGHAGARAACPRERARPHATAGRPPGHGQRAGARAGPGRAGPRGGAAGLAGAPACGRMGTERRRPPPLGRGRRAGHVARARARALQRGAHAAPALPGGLHARGRRRVRGRAGHRGAPARRAALAARRGRDGAAAHRPHQRDPAPGVRRPVGLRPAWEACPPPRSRG